MLKGAAAKSWASKYIDYNIKALSGILYGLTPEEAVSALTFVDKVVLAHTGQDSSKFLAK